jgi:uncharacterized delta-60 repeat protein
MKKTYNLILFIALALTLQAQPGTPDLSFGKKGFISHSIHSSRKSVPAQPRDIFQLHDGKIIVLFGTLGNQFGRFFPDGRIDSTYDGTGYSESFTGSAVAAVMQADEKIVALANTDDYNTNFMLVRFNTDGTIDRGFGYNGYQIQDLGSNIDYPASLIMQPDGKILAGGSTNRNGKDEFAILRLDRNGNPDNSFGVGGMITTSFESSTSAKALILLPDNSIMAFGGFYNNPAGDLAMAKYKSDGSVDSLFGTSGKLVLTFGQFMGMGCVLYQASNNKILLGGISSDISGRSRFKLGRFNTDGTLDLSYNDSGFSTVDFDPSTWNLINNIALQPDGKTLLSGMIQDGVISYFGLARLNQDGTQDMGFGTRGKQVFNLNTNNSIWNYSMKLLSSGNILMDGATFDNSDSSLAYRFHLVEFDTIANLYSGFGKDGVLSSFVPKGDFSYQIGSFQADGKPICFVNDGEFFSNDTYLQRFNLDGTVDSSFAPNGKRNIVNGIHKVLPDGKFLVLPYTPDSIYLNIYKYLQSGEPDPGFGNNGVLRVINNNKSNNNAITQLTDGKIIIAGTNPINGYDHWYLQRFNADGTMDNQFGNNGAVATTFEDFEYIQDIGIQADGKLNVIGIGYIQTPFGDNLDGLLARYNTDGKLDTSLLHTGKKIFDYSNSDIVYQLTIQKDQKIIVAGGSYDYSNDPFFLIRLNADGTMDKNFGLNGRQGISSVAYHLLTSDQKILVAESVLGQENKHFMQLTRLQPNGSIDNSFGINGIAQNVFLNEDNQFFFANSYKNLVYLSGNSFGKDFTGIIARYHLDSTGNVLQCPVNKLAYTGNLHCSAEVNDIDPVVPTGQTINAYTYKLSGATKASGTGTASGKTFYKGITFVQYTSTSDTSMHCSFSVEVKDTTAPLITHFIAV